MKLPGSTVKWDPVPAQLPRGPVRGRLARPAVQQCLLHAEVSSLHTHKVPDRKDVTLPSAAPPCNLGPRRPLGTGDLAAASWTDPGVASELKIRKLKTVSTEGILILQQQGGGYRNVHALNISCGLQRMARHLLKCAGVRRALTRLQPACEAPWVSSGAERLINPLVNLAQFAVFLGLVLFPPGQVSSRGHGPSAHPPHAQDIACNLITGRGRPAGHSPAGRTAALASSSLFSSTNH